MEAPLRNPESPLRVSAVAGSGNGSITQGARWVGPSQVVAQMSRIITTFGLTAFLTPGQFGVVALVMLAMGFFERALGDTGTSTAIVRQQDLSEGLASTVLALNVVVGLATTAFFLVAAAPVAHFLGDAEAIPYVRGIALLPTINALGFVPLALFRRLQQFKSLAVANFTNALFTGVTSLVLAVIGFGAWSIVLGNLVGSLASVVLAWAMLRWRPIPYVRWRSLKEISTFSAYLTAQNIFGYISFAGDRFVVGRLVGTVALGHYGLANRLMRYPVNTVAQTYRSVVFPRLSKLQDDPVGMVAIYRQSVEAIALIVFPICFMVAAVAYPLVDVALPGRWSPTAPILALIALTAPIQAIATTTGSIYNVTGRTDLAFRWQVGSSIVLMACYLIGSRWDGPGVAAGYLAGTVLLLVPSFAIPLRLVGATATRTLSGTAVVIAASAASGLVAYLCVQELADRGSSPYLQVIAGGCAGTVLYVGYLVVARPAALGDVLRLFRRSRGATSRG